MGQRKDRQGRRRGPEYRALVTGDRNWASPEVTHKVLDEYQQRFPGHRMRVIEGGAKGADAAAAQWAKLRGAEHIQEKAQWGKYGRNAGPMRNRKMLREYDPDAVLGFHDDISRSKGTKHMIGLVTQKHEQYGPREVRIYNSKGERTFKQGADLDPDQLKFIRRQQRREQKARRKNNPAANGEGVIVFKASLAELGEISKKLPSALRRGATAGSAYSEALLARHAAGREARVAHGIGRQARKEIRRIQEEVVNPYMNRVHPSQRAADVLTPEEMATVRAGYAQRRKLLDETALPSDERFHAGVKAGRAAKGPRHQQQEPSTLQDRLAQYKQGKEQVRQEQRAQRNRKIAYGAGGGGLAAATGGGLYAYKRRKREQS